MLLRLLQKAAERCGFFMATVLAFCVLASSAQAQEGKWVAMNKPAAKLVLSNGQGQEIDLTTYKGRVVVINFWATWCPPCVAEMPSLQTLHDRNNSVVVLGVNYHESVQKINDFATKQRISFPMLRDAWHDASTDWQVQILPNTFIVDKKGIVRWKVTGDLDWASAEVDKRLRPLIDAKNP